MRRARIEMIYHLRSADCASAYRNPGRAVWRLQRHLQVDDEHLLHGYASPAFLHDLLQTLAEPLRRNSSNLWTELSKWMS